MQKKTNCQIALLYRQITIKEDRLARLTLSHIVVGEIYN